MGRGRDSVCGAERQRMADEMHQARYKTALELRRSGGIGNLAQGPEIQAHGLATRLIAWPGTGYQTESVHVVTLKPGDESERYAYQLAEEAFLCHKGHGEVFLRDQWCPMKPGDMAYFPEGVERALRNPGSNRSDFILVNQITPPQLDLYAPSGFYAPRHGVMNLPACDKARLCAEPVKYSTINEMAYHEHTPEVRAWNLEPAEVRRGGALFNVYRGAHFSGLGVDSFRLILWPGAGTRTVGFNFALWPPDVPEAIHTHPVSDECLIVWSGQAQFYMGAGWLDAETNDCALAPCGIYHGTRNHVDCIYGGFASPPQLDLLMNSGFYENGLFKPAPSEILEA